MVIRRGGIKSAASLAAQVAVLALIAFALMLRTPQVSGFSMEPQIDTGEVVVIDTLAYHLGTPRRGDIVTFRHAGASPESFVKRLVGLPGDRVRIDRGVVFVNGVALAEPYVAHPDSRSFPELTVPPHAYYVLGDNRRVSNDSRAWGFVERNDLVGRVLLGVWPPGKLGPLH